MLGSINRSGQSERRWEQNEPLQAWPESGTLPKRCKQPTTGRLYRCRRNSLTHAAALRRRCWRCLPRRWPRRPETRTRRRPRTQPGESWGATWLPCLDVGVLCGHGCSGEPELEAGRSNARPPKVEEVKKSLQKWPFLFFFAKLSPFYFGLFCLLPDFSFATSEKHLSEK